jgi:hypothetical protein
MKVPGKKMEPSSTAEGVPSKADGRARERKEVRRSDYLLLLESMTGLTPGSAAKEKSISG